LIKSRLDVFNHNIEAVPRLYPTVRPEANCDRSPEVLKRVQQYDSFGRVTGVPTATWYIDMSNNAC